MVSLAPRSHYRVGTNDYTNKGDDTHWKVSWFVQGRDWLVVLAYGGARGMVERCYAYQWGW